MQAPRPPGGPLIFNHSYNAESECWVAVCAEVSATRRCPCYGSAAMARINDVLTPLFTRERMWWAR